MSVRKGKQVVAGTPNITTGHHVGEIFWTSRLDNKLNGAVDADGATYSVEAFTGEQSVPELLRKGSLPFVSMTEYESIVSANGSCRAWGWDNGDTFRVPTLKDVYLMAGQAESAGEFINESLPNITGELPLDCTIAQGDRFFYNEKKAGVLRGYNMDGVLTIKGSASRSSSVYQDGAKVRPDSVRYRAMVQIATGVKEDATQLKEYKFNNPHFFGESKWTDVDPNNASWLVSNGSFHSGATYVDYYNWLTDVKSGNKTVDGVSVKSVDDEYTDYDWVVNTADNTFRLPLLNGEEDLVGERFDDLALVPSGGTYTAPANGEITCLLSMSGAYSNMAVARNGQTLNTFYASGTISLGDTFKANKGDVFTIFYSQASGTPTKNKFMFTYAKGNGSLYFYVGDTLQDPALINAGGVLSDVADLKQNKIDREGNHTVVETYRNGSSWYRIWSDGWIEQAVHLNTTTGGLKTLTLLRSFSSSNYFAQASGQSYRYTFGVSDRSKDKITVHCYGDYGITDSVLAVVSVYACGY